MVSAWVPPLNIELIGLLSGPEISIFLKIFPDNVNGESELRTTALDYFKNYK